MESSNVVDEANSTNIEEDFYLPADFNELTSKLKLKAQRELNETEEGVRNGIQKIKELIKEEGVLTCPSDDFILLFLRVKKFNLKRSYEQIKEYSYLRHLYMNYYGFLSEDNIMPVYLGGVCGILPKRDREGRVILYFRTCEITPLLNAGMDSDNILRAVQVLGHFVLMHPATQISGMCIISDMSVNSIDVLQVLFKYIRWALPSIHVFPARIQKIDCINTNVVVRTLINLVRHLIPSKIIKRTTFHGSDYTKLLKSYDASILPEEFGGTLGPIKELTPKFYPKFEEYISTLQASNRYFTRKDTIPYPQNEKELSGFFK